MSVIVNAGNSPFLVSHTTVSDATIVSGGTMVVESHGIAVSTTVDSTGFGFNNGGLAVVAGGTALHTTISNGGQEGVFSGGTDSAARVDSGGGLFIQSGGTGISATVSGDAGEWVSSGGRTSHTVILAGGVEFVSSGGLAVSTTANNAGVGPTAGGLVLSGANGGGTASGALISSGAQEAVFSGGTNVSATVDLAGTLFVFSGGTDRGTIVKGTLDDGVFVQGMVSSAGGIVSTTKVEAGGNLNILSGGVGVSATLAGAGTNFGVELVSVSGQISNTVISHGGLAFVSSGGLAVSTTVLSTGFGLNAGGLVLSATDGGGTASNTVVRNDGQEVIFSGGLDVSATISAGGGQYVFADGSATNGTVKGLLDVGFVSGSVSYAGGTAVATLVESGGLLNVFSGGTAIDPTVGPRGTLIVESAGAATLNGGVIGSGGLVETASGGRITIDGTVTNSGKLYASGATGELTIAGVLSGGSAEIDNGLLDIQQSSSENVAFQANGTGGLELDDAVGGAFTGKVSGFAQDGRQFIDLTQITSAGATIGYTPANAADTSGTLTVTNNGTSATIDLIGHYTTASFAIVADSNGDAEVVRNPNPSKGADRANAAVLGSYIAGTFATAAGHGGTVVTEDTQAATLHTLTQPRHG